MEAGIGGIPEDLMCLQVFPCDEEVFTAIYLLPTESFSNQIDCTPAFHSVHGQTVILPQYGLI